MGLFTLLLIKLLPLYSVIIVGFLTEKIFKISKEKFARFIVYFLLPIVVFTGITNTKINLSTLSIPIFYFSVACFITFLVYLIAGIRWKDSNRNLLAFIAGTSNTGYLGIPVVLAVFGERAIGIATLVLIGSVIYTNTVGFYIAATGEYSAKESLLKIIRLPSFYAFILGVIVNVIGIHFGKLYYDSVNFFDQTFGILGMFLIGLSLSENKKFVFDWLFVAVSFIGQFILWPLLIGILFFIDSHTLNIYSQFVHRVLLVISVLPAAVNVIIYTTYLKIQPEKVAFVVFLSTLFALFYIPIITSIFLR